MVKENLFKMLDMASKLEDIDRIIKSCATLNNGEKLRKVLSKLKKELAQHLIDYYEENCESINAEIEPINPKTPPKVSEKIKEAVSKSDVKKKNVQKSSTDSKIDKLKKAVK